MNKTLLLLLTISISSVFGQNTEIDSLLSILNMDKKDTNQINTLNSLSEKAGWRKGDYDTAFYYATEAKKLALELNFKKGEASAFNNIGIFHLVQNNYEDALANYEIALKIRQEIGDKKGVAATYNNIGIIHKKQSDYDEALNNYFASLKIKEEIDDKKGIATSYLNIGSIFQLQGNYSEALKNFTSGIQIYSQLEDKIGIANSHNNIGVINRLQGNYPEALKHYFMALKIREELNDMLGVSHSYNNIGIVNGNLGDYDEALKYYSKSLKIHIELDNKNGISDAYNNMGNSYENQGNYTEALKSHLAALKIKEEIEDKNGIASSRNNIGNVYRSQDKYAEALENYFVAIKIREEIGDKKGIADTYSNIGLVFISLNKKNEAREYLTKGLHLANEIGVKEIIKHNYLNLSLLDSAEGNDKSALENYKLYIVYRDSIDNEETREKTIQEQMTYEFEKKEAIAQLEQEKKDVLALAQQEQKDAITKAEIAQQKQQRNYFIIGFGLVFLLALFIFRSYKKQRKANVLITKQKNMVENQKHIIEEKHREITDSINYAERIQRSFLASKEILDQNLGDYFVFFRPKDVVSGDFYWAAELNDENFAFSVADSTGHGVPGAIMSLLNITSLEKSIETETEPHKILNKTRQIIINRLKKDGSPEGGKDGMDCNLVVLNKDKTELKFASANNPVFIIRNDELIEYKGDKMPIGRHAKENDSFTLHQLKLQKGDVIYTLTDGFPDQFGGPKGKKYMIKNLKSKLLLISQLPMEKQEKELASEFDSWKSENEQIDDVCIMGIRI